MSNTTYVAYLDEFGHDGYFIRRGHQKHGTSPVFGYAGFIIPAQNVRSFSISIFKAKERLWNQEQQHSKKPKYQWEKKGADAFRVSTIEKKKSTNLRRTMFRLLKELQKTHDGETIICGFEKYKNESQFNSTRLYELSLRRSIEMLDKYCSIKHSELMVCLDYHTRRRHLVKVSGAAMFGENQCRTLLEPVFQGESELYQTLQFSDWIASITGKICAYNACPNEYQDYYPFKKYFESRLSESKIPSNVQYHKINTGMAEKFKAALNGNQG